MFPSVCAACLEEGMGLGELAETGEELSELSVTGVVLRLEVLALAITPRAEELVFFFLFLQPHPIQSVSHF